MTTPKTPLGEITQQQAQDREAADARSQELAKFDELGNTFLLAMRILVTHLMQHTGKVQVTNPTTTVLTPDSAQVVSAVNKVASAVTASKFDPTALAESLNAAHKKLDDLPEKLPKPPELPPFPDKMEVPGLADYMAAQEKRMQTMEEVYKNLKVVVEAGPVEVNPTPVNFVAPKQDWGVIEQGIKTLADAWAALKLPTPEVTINNDALSKELEALNGWLKKLNDKSFGGGGGGGGGSPYMLPDGVGTPSNVLLEANGSIPITDTHGDPLAAYVTQDEAPNDSAISYYGFAKVDGTWLIMARDKTGLPYTDRYANLSNNGSESGYVDAWGDRASLDYTYIFDLEEL